MRQGIHRFSGRHVLITGAASGIGQATALELARRGARLALADVNLTGAASTVEQVRRLGGEAHAFRVDLTQPAEVDELAARVTREQGPVEVLINNAGVGVIAPFLRTTEVDWEWVFSVNVWGPLRLARALLPAMLERGGGHLAVVASLAGLIGAPGMAAYTASKFAMVGFCEALRLEIADRGVGVTVLCPGYVKTNFTKANRYHNDAFRRFLDAPPSWYGLSREEVAARFADGIEAGRPLVVLGPEKLGWWIKRAAPEAAFAITRWVARRAHLGIDAEPSPEPMNEARSRIAAAASN